MRLPLKEKEKYTEHRVLINEFHNDLKAAFESTVKKNFKVFNTKVMLADFSVIDISSFDPTSIVNLLDGFEKKIKSRLTKWQVVPVQSTKSDDLR